MDDAAAPEVLGAVAAAQPVQPVPELPESADTPITEVTQHAGAAVPNDEALRALVREGIEALVQEADTVRQLFELHDSRLEQRRKEEEELQARRRSLLKRAAGLKQRYTEVAAQLHVQAPHDEALTALLPKSTMRQDELFEMSVQNDVPWATTHTSSNNNTRHSGRKWNADYNETATPNIATAVWASNGNSNGNGSIDYNWGAWPDGTDCDWTAKGAV